MTDYLGKWFDRKTGKNWFFLYGPVYILIMAGSVFVWPVRLGELAGSSAAQGGFTAAVVLASLAVAADICCPMVWRKEDGRQGDKRRECRGQDGQREEGQRTEGQRTKDEWEEGQRLKDRREEDRRQEEQRTEGQRSADRREEDRRQGGQRQEDRREEDRRQEGQRSNDRREGDGRQEEQQRKDGRREEQQRKDGQQEERRLIDWGQEVRPQDDEPKENTAALYQMLEKFKDTILFEYLYSNGAIHFTPNASEQIEMPVLRGALEKYVNFPPVPEEIRSFEFRMKSDKEDYHWCICHICAEYDEAQKPVRLIGKLDDISKQKEREEQLLFQSTRDGLTGVYNKTAFEYMMEETLKRGSSGCLYMIDIDNFKDVNDQYGHPAGDKILVEIGKMLREIYRDSDLIGRVGGDEFVVYSESSETRERALKLLNTTADFIPEEGHRISVSIGIASSTGDAGEEYQELFSRADQAMYRAKQEGKNRIAVYEE